MTTEYNIMKWKDFSVAELRIIGKSFNKYIKIGPVSKIPKKDLIVLLDKDLNLNETTGEVTMKAGGMTLGKAKLELTEKGKQKTAKAAEAEAKAIYAKLKPDILGAGEAEARALYASLKPDVLKTSEQMMGAAADAASISDQVALMMKDAEIRMAEMRLQTLMATREKIIEEKALVQGREAAADAMAIRPPMMEAAAAEAPAKNKKFERIFFDPNSFESNMESATKKGYRQTLENDYERALKDINFLIDKGSRFAKDSLEDLKTVLVNSYRLAVLTPWAEKQWKNLVQLISDSYRQEIKGKRVKPDALQIELFQRKFKDDYKRALEDLDDVRISNETLKNTDEARYLKTTLEEEYKLANGKFFKEILDKIKDFRIKLFQSKYEDAYQTALEDNEIIIAFGSPSDVEEGLILKKRLVEAYYSAQSFTEVADEIRRYALAVYQS